MEILNILLDIVFFAGGVFFLIKTADVATTALERLADSGKVGTFAITSFLGAIATSLPELFVCLASAIKGETHLVIGLLVGSNIANITISVGMASFIGGDLRVLGKFVKKDVFRAFLMTLFPIILMLDKELNRLDGILLILGFIFYYFVVFRENTYKEEFDFDVDDKGFEFVGKLFHRTPKYFKRKQGLWFLIGILGLLFSAEIVVRAGELVAYDFGMPMILVGLFLVAVGTSLPEIVFGIKACKKKKTGMLFGNLLGSLVSNSTLILGLAVIISPISIGAIELSSFLAIMMYLLSFLVLWFFVKTKLSLVRWEGFLLTLLYILFIGVEYLLGA